MSPQIIINFKDNSIDELRTRCERLIRTTPPFKFTGVGLSIQFLRSVFSRASLCLPAYYYFLGAKSAHTAASTSSDYPFKIAQSYSQFSDLSTLTLSCRKIFDHAKGLTGGSFSKLPDNTLEEHAEYWSKNASQNHSDAFEALKFLRQFFKECSKTDTDLLKSISPLQNRIGLLKQHADRAAAHLTLEDYSIDIIDLTHFTAACAIIGEIIRSFDAPGSGHNYFDELDKASYQAAKRIFPNIPKFQLFTHWKMQEQSKNYWQSGEYHGVQMLLHHVHNAVGGDPK